MKRIRLNLKDRSYDILVGYGLLAKTGSLLKKAGIGSDAVIITNKSVFKEHGKALENSLLRAGISTRIELVPDSERAKSVDVASGVIENIARYDRLKRVFIIAFGGGVVGDLAGFIASVYKRGIPYVQIPTTLLAQVDSSIGGKVAIDLPVAKNLVGSFYQPKLVISDIAIIKTLPMRQIRNGMAEIIKYGIIKDYRLFCFLEENMEKIIGMEKISMEYVIARCSKIKAEIVTKDEFDRKSVRAVLNYGHTIGHAIETSTGYGKYYCHGEAVALGMMVASEISLRLGLLGFDDVCRIQRLIRRAGLPMRFKGAGFSKIRTIYQHDKKFLNKKNRFILPVQIGQVKIVEGIQDDIIKKAFEKYA